MQDLTVTNTYTPPTKDVTAEKKWSPAGLAEELKSAVKFQLYRYTTDAANAEAVGDAVDLKSDNSVPWQYTWTGMPQADADGKIYTYYVTETETPANFTADNVQDLTVTNTYNLTTVAGEKTWENVPAGASYPTIKVNLLQNGETIKTETLTAAPYKWSWTDLPQYDSTGNAYTYTVTEDAVKGYTSIINGYNITNRYTGLDGDPDFVRATKAWQNGGPQPEVCFQLRRSADGIAEEPVREVICVNASNRWRAEWTGLPTYAPNAMKYTYTIAEGSMQNGVFRPGAPANYEAALSRDGNNLTMTNTWTVPLRTVEAQKVWSGGTARPRVAFQLYRSSANTAAEPVGRPVWLTGNGPFTDAGEYAAWQYRWVNMPAVDHAGAAYTYYVTEVNVPADYAADGVNDLTVTNTYRPPYVPPYNPPYNPPPVIRAQIPGLGVGGYMIPVTGAETGSFLIPVTGAPYIPNTGDESNGWLFATIMIISLAAFAALRLIEWRQLRKNL